MIDKESVIDTVLNEESADDLLSRGYARRDLARIAAIFGVGAMAAASGRPAWASAGVPDPAPSAKTRIGANECWTGPLAPGQAAAAKMIAQGNRYSPHDERSDFIKAVMSVEGVPFDHVAPWPGSSDPRTVHRTGNAPASTLPGTPRTPCRGRFGGRDVAPIPS